MDTALRIAFKGICLDGVYYCNACCKELLGLEDKSAIRVWVLTNQAKGVDVHEATEPFQCTLCERRK
jgi:hypothetical protein